MNPSGFFVAFEGVDGVGKTTQLRRLAERLRANGRELLLVREPGGTRLGEEVRRILLQRKEIPLTVETELLLFLASRVQLYEERIRPALEAGHVVISDRYYLSTIVYQGIAGGLGEERAVDLCGRVLEDRRPDLYLVITLAAEECRSRLGSDLDRFEARPGFLEKVERGFLEVTGLPGDRIVRVDGSGSVEEVAARVEEEVRLAL